MKKSIVTTIDRLEFVVRSAIKFNLIAPIFSSTVCTHSKVWHTQYSMVHTVQYGTHGTVWYTQYSMVHTIQYGTHSTVWYTRYSMVHTIQYGTHSTVQQYNRTGVCSSP